MKRLMMLFLCSLLACSCMASRSEVDTLAARSWDQEQQQRRMQGQLTALDQELTRLLAALEGVSTPMRATQANLWAEVESLRMQTATMQGQMEELQRTLQGAQGGGDQIAELSRQVAFLDRSLTMIAGQLALNLGPRPEGAAADAVAMPAGPDQFEPRTVPGLPDPAVREPTAAPTDDPAQALYDRALQAFHDRNYAQARSMWDEFARAFPQHELVSNALFWQGESFFQMEEYSQAVLAYQDVISKHPQSTKYAAAMLKQGVSFFRLGKDRAGTLVLEDLINRYPGLPEAARAKVLLDEHGNR